LLQEQFSRISTSQVRSSSVPETLSGAVLGRLHQKFRLGKTCGFVRERWRWTNFVFKIWGLADACGGAVLAAVQLLRLFAVEPEAKALLMHGKPQATAI
jgi:hypothetical protein